METQTNQNRNLFLATILAASLTAPALAASQDTLDAHEANSWTFDVSLYGLAAGMSGDVTVRGINRDLNVGCDKIWDNLDFGMMGKVRVGYDRWALTTDVIYMSLDASKDSVSATFDQSAFAVDKTTLPTT